MKLLRAVLALEMLTILMWFTRIRNVWADDATSSSTRLTATAIGVAFVALATVALVAAWRLRQGAGSGAARLLIGGLAVGSSFYWLIRVIQIAGRDHATGFIVVHTLLGVAVIASSYVVLRRLRASSDGTTSPRNVDHHRRATTL